MAFNRSSSVSVSIEKKANMKAESANREAEIKKGRRKGLCRSDDILSNYFTEDWCNANEGSNMVCV